MLDWQFWYLVTNSPFKDSHSHPIHTCFLIIASNLVSFSFEDHGNKLVECFLCPVFLFFYCFLISTFLFKAMDRSISSVEYVWLRRFERHPDAPQFHLDTSCHMLVKVFIYLYQTRWGGFPSATMKQTSLCLRQDYVEKRQFDHYVQSKSTNLRNQNTFNLHISFYVYCFLVQGTDFLPQINHTTYMLAHVHYEGLLLRSTLVAQYK